VDNLKAKRAAEQDAKNTNGVWRVKNLLKVRPAQPLADDVVSQNVTAALSQDPYVDSYEVTASANRGVVTLSGAVYSHFERAEAEDVASRTNGVLDVKNNIAVNAPAIVHYDTSYDPYWSYGRRPIYDTPWTYTTDREVKHDIEEQLFWSPWVDRADITVKVENGTATLTGRADSWFEYNKATDNAFEGGAREVFNNIVIE
jgi:osmotically-inducible protein OsmY